VKSFESLPLHPSLQKAIQLCGYKEPTPVQAKAIPVVLEGKDLVASAQTGTGKTAAFVLPALNFLLSEPVVKKPRILILTPTRELAAQITKSAALYGKFSHFKMVSLVGGMPYHHQLKDLARGVDIIVATPGRLIDHIENKKVDLSHIQMLVLDEADRMLDMGFIDDVNAIAKLIPETRQTLLFSATIDKQLTTVIRHLLKNPVRIDLSTGNLTAPKIKQEAYRTKSLHHKTQLLKHFLMNKNIYKAIIFSATKANADKLTDELINEGLSVSALHGDLRQNVRNRVIEKFQRGRLQYLIATDVAARGLHVNDITHVFNYDLPKFAEDYVHRIGRTGRAGKEGMAISFVSSQDAHHLSRIEKYIGEKIKLHNQIDLSEREEKTAPPMAHAGDDEDDRPRRRDFGHRDRDSRKPRSFEKREDGFSKPRRERSDKPRSFEKRDDRSSEPRRELSDKPRSFEKREDGFAKPRRDYSDKSRNFEKRDDRSSEPRRERSDKPRSFEKREDGFAKPRRAHSDTPRSSAKNQGNFRKRRDNDDLPTRFLTKSDSPFKSTRHDDDAPRRTEKRDHSFKKPRRDDDRSPKRFAKADAPFKKRREEGDAPKRKQSDDPRVSYGKTSKPWAGKKPAKRSDKRRFDR
jgi:superfamily II DNA/RNA helicase